MLDILDPIVSADPLVQEFPLTKNIRSRWICLPNRMAGGTWYDIGREQRHITGPGPFSDIFFYGSSRVGGFGEIRFPNRTSGTALAIPAGTSLGSNATIAFFFQPSVSPNNTTQVLLDGNFRLSWEDNGSLGIRQISITTDATYNLTSSLEYGTRYHVIIVIDGTSLTTYLNGVEVSFYSGAADDFDFSWIGCNGTGTECSGAIDDLVFFDKSLTEKEVHLFATDCLEGSPQSIRRLDTAPLWTPGISCITRCRGRSLVVNSYALKMRGYHRINEMVCRMRGYARIYTPITGVKDRGYGRVNVSVTPKIRGRGRVLVSCSPKFRGKANIQNTLLTFNLKGRGKSRIANNAIEGYAVWVGVGAMPNLSSAPSSFSSTLPISIAHSLPGSGDTETLYVVVRKRNKYGLYSQNQKPTIIQLDEFGIVRNDIPAPAPVVAYPQEDNLIKLIATYPTLDMDRYPADKWKIWINRSGDVSGDPDIVADVSSSNYYSITDSIYAVGDWIVSFALFREVDSVLSPITPTTVTMPNAPLKPVPIPSGYQVP